MADPLNLGALLAGGPVGQQPAGVAPVEPQGTWVDYKAKVPSWLQSVAQFAARRGRNQAPFPTLLGSYAPDPTAYQKALDTQKMNEWILLKNLGTQDPSRRSNVATDYLNAYRELTPFQVQRDVMEGRATPTQAQGYLSLYGNPDQRGFAEEAEAYEKYLASGRQHLADYQRQLAEYGTDPRYTVQRNALTSTIENMQNNLLPQWERNLQGMKDTVSKYAAMQGGYKPTMAPGYYEATAKAMQPARDEAFAAYQARRKQLEEANAAAEAASTAYKRSTGEYDEARGAELFNANLASRKALTDFIDANRERFAKGGLAAKPFWDKPRPEGKPKVLSVKKKAAAKRRAKAAGRPYPNLVDNAFAARKKGK